MRPGHPLSRGRLNLDKYDRAEHALVSVSGGLFRSCWSPYPTASRRIIVDWS